MQARLHIQLTDAQGHLLAERRACNAVLQTGATLLARLFAAQGSGISHMALGTSDAPESEAFATAALQDAVEVPIGADAFTIEPPDTTQRSVRVRVRATVPAAAAVGTLREAALVSRSGETATLYNRVVFSPIEKGNDHELTLFWDIAFPYGDLQGLL
jgi:type IV secretory pathway TrbL component